MVGRGHALPQRALAHVKSGYNTFFYCRCCASLKFCGSIVIRFPIAAVTGIEARNLTYLKRWLSLPINHVVLYARMSGFVVCAQHHFMIYGQAMLQ